MQKHTCVLCFAGAKRCFGVPTTHKLPLTRENLLTVCNAYQTNPSHNDLLFMVQLLTGTKCLMCLGELTWLDKIASCDYLKVSMCHTVSFHTDALSFWLPGHKTDQFFEGNRLILHKSLTPDAYSHFASYHSSRDRLFCTRPELWLHADRTIPTCSWFINCLRHRRPIHTCQ